MVSGYPKRFKQAKPSGGKSFSDCFWSKDVTKTLDDLCENNNVWDIDWSQYKLIMESCHSNVCSIFHEHDPSSVDEIIKLGDHFSAAQR